MGSKILTLTICMFLFSFVFVSAQMEVSVDKELTQCIDSLGKIAKCESIPLKDKSKYTELPETSKLIIKEDGMYLDNLRIKAEKDASVYIAEKKGTTYHVDNLNKEKVSAYLEFQYDIQPDYITHIDKYNNKVNTYFPSDWTWTPNCVGSGEEQICNGGIVRVYVTDLTEESIGSETFPIGITGPTWASDGKFSGLYNGADSYTQITESNQELFNGTGLANGFTISAWINPRSLGESGTGMILSKATGFTGGDGFSFYNIATNKFEFRINIGTARSSAANSVILGTWQHVLITVSSAQLANFYVNGVLSGTANQDLVQAISTITTTNAPRIGNRATATDRTFDGDIDEVVMYNRTLTTAEITELYNSYTLTSAGPIKNSDKNTTGLILDVDFDDSSVADKSGLGNHGTNTNVTYTPIQLFYNSLVNGVDYSLDTKTGLFTILNPNYVYSWMSASWGWNYEGIVREIAADGETSFGENSSIMGIMFTIIFLSVILTILLRVFVFKKDRI